MPKNMTNAQRRFRRDSSTDWRVKAGRWNKTVIFRDTRTHCWPIYTRNSGLTHFTPPHSDIIQLRNLPEMRSISLKAMPASDVIYAFENFVIHLWKCERIKSRACQRCDNRGGVTTISQKQIELTVNWSRVRHSFQVIRLVLSADVPHFPDWNGLTVAFTGQLQGQSTKVVPSACPFMVMLSRNSPMIDHRMSSYPNRYARRWIAVPQAATQRQRYNHVREAQLHNPA